MSKIFKRIHHKLNRIRLHPIRAFAFHQVSDEFDETTMWRCDWTETEQFKKTILNLCEKYVFISLVEAAEKIRKDHFRIRNYAVLTCDDGWRSICPILQWIFERNIPITLFVNPAYLRGEKIRENGFGSLLSESDLVTLINKYPNISIASHGWDHSLCDSQDCRMFYQNVDNSAEYLKKIDRYIPFFAYPCGRNSDICDNYLIGKGITPVYCDGEKNYKNSYVIHRECIDGKWDSK